MPPMPPMLLPTPPPMVPMVPMPMPMPWDIALAGVVADTPPPIDVDALVIGAALATGATVPPPLALLLLPCAGPTPPAAPLWPLTGHRSGTDTLRRCDAAAADATLPPPAASHGFNGAARPLICNRNNPARVTHTQRAKQAGTPAHASRNCAWLTIRRCGCVGRRRVDAVRASDGRVSRLRENISAVGAVGQLRRPAIRPCPASPRVLRAVVEFPRCVAAMHWHVLGW
jgi:hypothetical protein